MRLVGIVSFALLASTFAVRLLNWTAKKFEKVNDPACRCVRKPAETTVGRKVPQIVSCGCL